MNWLWKRLKQANGWGPTAQKGYRQWKVANQEREEWAIDYRDRKARRKKKDAYLLLLLLLLLSRAGGEPALFLGPRVPPL
jgi:hypothetical protein